MPTTLKIKSFAADLRRVLYVSQMLRTYVEWMRMDKNCPSWMKADLNNLTNSINRLHSDIHATAAPEHWEVIKSHLTSEQVNDLALLLDTCYDIVNISEITELIKDARSNMTVIDTM